MGLLANMSISVLLDLKLDQLIRAAARGRRNDEMVRLSTQGTVSCGVFYLPQHRTLSTRHPLALCHDFADEGHLKMLGSPPLDRTRGLQCSR